MEGDGGGGGEGAGLGARRRAEAAASERAASTCSFNGHAFPHALLPSLPRPCCLPGHMLDGEHESIFSVAF